MIEPKKIGIVGCGVIGQKVATELDRGTVPGATLAALSSRDMEKTLRFAQSLEHEPPVVQLDELVSLSDLVIETATGAALGDIAAATLEAGKDLMARSCGALLERDDLFQVAEQRGATIYWAPGARPGLDGVGSARTPMQQPAS